MDEQAEITIAESVWQRLLVETNRPRRLQSGALVKSGEDGIEFYVTASSLPDGWQYPFASTVAGGEAGALLGLATFIGSTVKLEVCNGSAVAAVEADFDGQAGELDEYTYEAEVNAAFAGNADDAAWLRERWFELVNAFRSLSA